MYYIVKNLRSGNCYGLFNAPSGEDAINAAAQEVFVSGSPHEELVAWETVMVHDDQESWVTGWQELVKVLQKLGWRNVGAEHWVETQLAKHADPNAAYTELCSLLISFDPPDDREAVFEGRVHAMFQYRPDWGPHSWQLEEW